MANYLAQWRKLAGKTQQQLADECGCRRETIAKLEAGRHEPSLKLAYSITRALNANHGKRIECEVTDVFPMDMED